MINEDARRNHLKSWRYKDGGGWGWPKYEFSVGTKVYYGIYTMGSPPWKQNTTGDGHGALSRSGNHSDPQQMSIFKKVI